MEVDSELFVAKFRKILKTKDQRSEKIQELILKTPNKVIIDSIINKIKEYVGQAIWNQLLNSLDKCSEEEKVLKIVMEVLSQLNNDEISIKIQTEVISRVCMEIGKFSMNSIVRLAQNCESVIEINDSKCVYWMQLLPCILSRLQIEKAIVEIDGITKTGKEYHQLVIESILRKYLPTATLPSIASMFREIVLTKQQLETLLIKICKNLKNSNHNELAAISFQIFELSMLCPSYMIVPLLSLNSYFHEKRYIKLYNEMNSESDLDSIEETSDRGIVEAEETVIFHFKTVTEYTCIEKNLVGGLLKNISYVPSFILSPFMITMLSSVAKVTTYNGDIKISQSQVLPYLKQVFQINDRYANLLRESAWLRHIKLTDPVDLPKLLAVLVDNVATGQDVSTAGLLGLSVTLLKSKHSPRLNKFGTDFLLHFIKKRQMFSYDIVSVLVKLILTEVHKDPIIDCFKTLSLLHDLRKENCESALRELIDNLTSMDLNTSIACMGVLHDYIQKSTIVRDLMIDAMRKAMYKRNPDIRKIAVYGFCVVLRKLRNTTKRNSSDNYALCPMSQISISGYSHVSQLSLSSVNNPQRNVDIMILEIVGILRKCFSQDVDTKIILYESLMQSVTYNPTIVSHILQFADAHFRSYFESDGDGFEMDFSKTIKKKADSEDDYGHGAFVVVDQIGKFLNFFVSCVLICEVNKYTLNLDKYQKVLNNLVNNMDSVSLEDLGTSVVCLDTRTSAIIPQYLNSLEALMTYAFYQIAPGSNEDYVTKFMKLFSRLQVVTKDAKKLQDISKKAPKKGMIIRPVAPLVIDSVWDLKTVYKFLQAVFTDNIKNTLGEKIIEIQQSREFSRYILQVTSEKFIFIASAPSHLHLKHCTTTFSYFMQLSRLIYESAIKKLKTLLEGFDLKTAELATECFKNAIIVVDTIYDGKFLEFLRFVTRKTSGSSLNEMIFMLVKTIQDFLESVLLQVDDEAADFIDDPCSEKIIIYLFDTLELLYQKFEPENKSIRDSFAWFLEFSKNYKPQHKSLSIISRVFFKFLEKMEPENYVEEIAIQLSKSYGSINESRAASDLPLELKIISEETVDSCFLLYLSNIRNQIEEVQFYILRMNSLSSLIKIPGKLSIGDSAQNLRKKQQSVLMKLASHIRIFTTLTNSQLPVPSSQIESLVKSLINLYEAMGNLIKHFCSQLEDFDYSFFKMEEFVKLTKKLAVNVYELIPYVEANIDLSGKNDKNNEPAAAKKKRKADLQSDKKRVLKQTRYFPRLVFSMEAFNKCVVEMDKNTKKNVAKYLHSGEVRDFRLSNKDILASLQKSADAGRNESLMENTYESQLEAAGSGSDNDKSDDEEDGSSSHSSTVINEQEAEEVLDDMVDMTAPERMTREKFLENFAKMPKKTSDPGSMRPPVARRGGPRVGLSRKRK